MARQRLTTTALLTLLVTASLLAGCASRYPPGPGPGEPDQPPQTEPETQPPPPEDVVPPRPAQDARAPTLALLRQSERSADDGDLESAIAYVERAIRLNSRDAELWLQLARLQLAAQRPDTAEQLAHKAIALADRESDNERQGWLLVADALQAQGDDEAAARIRARWRTYRG